MTALLALVLAAPELLTLDAALERARAHPRLIQARAAARQQQAVVEEARAGFLPTGRATADVAHVLTGPVATPGADTSTARVTLGQLLWDFGRTTGAYRAAAAGLQAAEADLALARLDVELDVRVAYLNALAAEQAVAVADDTIRQMEKRVAFAQASLEVGRKTRFDVVRAEVDLANARIQRIQAVNGAATTRTALSSAMGGDIGAAVLATPSAPPLPDLALEEASRRALAERPDLAALDHRIRQRREQLAVARSASYPVLEASASASWGDRDFTLLGQGWGSRVGATLTWSFLTGGADVARAREADAQLEQAEAGRNTLALAVRADAEQAALAVGEAVARREAAAALERSAREALALAEGRYEAGAGSILEVTDAQAAFTGARYGSLRAGLDVATARARLARAVGGR